MPTPVACDGAALTGYLIAQAKVLATLAEWQADPVTASNATVLLVVGLIHTNLEDYVEALRAVHAGQNLEMCAALLHRLSVWPELEMRRLSVCTRQAHPSITAGTVC